MKKYIKPTVKFVKLEAKNNIADADHKYAAVATTDDGVISTTYNLALMSETSVRK